MVKDTHLLEYYTEKLRGKHSGCYIDVIDSEIRIINRYTYPVRDVVIVTQDGVYYPGHSFARLKLINSNIFSFNDTEPERYICKYLDMFGLSYSRILWTCYFEYFKLFRNILDFNPALFLCLDKQRLDCKRAFAKLGNISKVFEANIKFLKRLAWHTLSGLVLAQECTKLNLSIDVFNYYCSDGYYLPPLNYRSREGFLYVYNYNKQITKYSCFEKYLLPDYWRLRDLIQDLVYYPKFPKDNSVQHIRELHDSAMRFYNNHLETLRITALKEKQEQYSSKFYKIAKQFEFQDDKYTIIACSDLNDLLIEGKTLHHCVGSYVDSVSEGREYILFLRKIQDIDTPYFTIDVTPDRHCRQIHGMCNCNVPNELVPFIQAWAKTFNIKLGDTSGVYCAL